MTLRMDIVSDVVCPWCVIGYNQLAKAAEDTGIRIDLHWHPFEQEMWGLLNCKREKNKQLGRIPQIIHTDLSLIHI